MKQVVYIDILFVTNLFLNYLLLRCTALLDSNPVRRLRLLLAAGVGGLFSLSILLPELSLPLSLLLKIVCCTVTVLCAFPLRGKRAFFRTAAFFFTASFLFAGAMLALWLLTAPRGMVYRNGSVYFDLSILTLAVSALVCYCVILVITRLTRKSAPQNHLCELTVCHGGKSIAGKALFDSGNALCEVFSGAPVIVAQADFLSPLMPPELRLPLEALQAAPAAGIRLIPYHAMNGSGVLPAFRAEKVLLHCAGKRYESSETYLAPAPKALSCGEYDALVGTVFFERGKELAFAVKRGGIPL